MDVQPDFRDLLKLFNENNVDYIVVGSYALAFHGSPRYTGDIDLYIHPTAANAENILRRLQTCGRYGYGHPLDQWQMYGIAATNVGWPTESKC